MTFTLSRYKVSDRNLRVICVIFTVGFSSAERGLLHPEEVQGSTTVNNEIFINNLDGLI